MSETPKGIQSLVGRKMTKKTKFLDVDVLISKLSVAQVLEIQVLAAENKSDEQGMELIQKVITMSVEGAEDLTADDFKAWPLDELSKLSSAIMAFSGIGGAEGK